MASKKNTKKTTAKKATAKTPPRPAAKPAADKAQPASKGETKPAAKNRKAKARGQAKKTAATKAGAKPTAKHSCTKAKCKAGTCPKRSLDGRSLIDRARECKDLEECRGFIRELGEAVEQFNTWLDEMHAQALSAEQTRDIYGEQISDLLEAVANDEARIAELAAELKKARSKPSRGNASQAVLDKLAELSQEVRTIRADLRRLLDGREPTTARRARVRRTARKEAAEERKRGRGRSAERSATAEPQASNGDAAMEGRPARRPANKNVGAFPKYSVLRGAACSLGVGKYGYPPEVCAPASFSRTEAAEILGTYAQNKYAGLAKWALITGLPIDDVVVPLVPAAPQGGGGRRAGKRAAAPTSSTPQRPKTTTTSKQAPRPSASNKSAAKSGRSNQQIIDQVLLTVARI